MKCFNFFLAVIFYCGIVPFLGGCGVDPLSLAVYNAAAPVVKNTVRENDGVKNTLKKMGDNLREVWKSLKGNFTGVEEVELAPLPEFFVKVFPRKRKIRFVEKNYKLWSEGDPPLQSFNKKTGKVVPVKKAVSWGKGTAI